jgi:hypothetical protein
MRNVRQLVRSHNGINDRRAVDGKGIAHCSLQFIRLGGSKTFAAAGAGQGGKVRIREFYAFPKWRQACAL